MPRKNNIPSNKTPSNNTPSNNNLLQNNTSSVNQLSNTIKNAAVYSIVFDSTQRLMDNIFGNRKIDVVEKNDYCDKIKEKYNNDKYNEFLELEYQKCYDKNL